MTMPHLMNCSHTDDGWCLGCVKQLWEEKEAIEMAYLETREGRLMASVQQMAELYKTVTPHAPIEEMFRG